MAMISWLNIMSLAALAVSAWMWSGILFNHKRVLTHLATAGLLAQAWWMLLTLFVAAVPDIYVIGSFAVLVVGRLLIKHWRFPYNQAGSGARDAWVVLALLAVGSFAYVITQHNGFRPEGWVWHGFYNGDTATFLSLTQKALIGSSGNPFGAGLPLEYPTLLHRSLAEALHLFRAGVDWIFYLPALTLAWVLLTVPMFFLLFDTWQMDVPGKVWPGYALQTGIVLYVMGLSWDAWVYPQSHFFLMGLFFLALACFTTAAKESSWRRWLLAALGLLVAAVLLLSNAVTGTAAAACALMFLFFTAQDKKRAAGERVLAALVCLAVIIFFVGAAPGKPQFGHLNFSYSAVPDMLGLWPVLTLLGVAAIWLLARFPLPAFFLAGLSGLAFVTFGFSNRDIVVANASRFAYHAVLASFPLLVPILVRLWYMVRREVAFTTHALVEKIAGYAIALLGLAMLALPAMAGVASATDNLFLKDEQRVSPAMQEAAWIIADHAPRDAVILANPNPPWVLPVLTGRSLLRAAYEDGQAYWLSANDDVLAAQRAAFAGDKQAQAKVVRLADYLLLTTSERQGWEPLPFTKIFDNQETVIYRLHEGI